MELLTAARIAMRELPLRPYQADAVATFLARPDKRLILAHAVGAGKTLTAIACSEAIHAKRILIVAPALARYVWIQEFAKWVQREAHGIRWGRAFKRLTHLNEIRKKRSFAADIQVVSYNLLRDITATKRDLIIFDEVHALRNPLSKQSRIAKAYMRAFPNTPALALSATPIPTEVANVWNVVDTLFPNALGPSCATGASSFAFREMYMRKEVSEYGTRYYGAKEDALPRLEKALAPLMHRVTEKDFAEHVPPLVASCMHVEEDFMEPNEVSREWVANMTGEERKSLAVICYRRETATQLYDWLIMRDWLADYSIYIVTGAVPIEERTARLIDARKKPKCLIIATCESVREAISLSFIKDALVVEWRSSPAQATQLLGRFARSDSTDAGITRVTYAVHSEENDQAETLQTRLTALSALMKTDAKSEILQNVFQPRNLDEFQLNRLFEKSFKVYKPNAIESWEEVCSEARNY